MQLLLLGTLGWWWWGWWWLLLLLWWWWTGMIVNHDRTWFSQEVKRNQETYKWETPYYYYFYNNTSWAPIKAHAADEYLCMYIDVRRYGMGMLVIDRTLWGMQWTDWLIGRSINRSIGGTQLAVNEIIIRIIIITRIAEPTNDDKSRWVGWLCFCFMQLQLEITRYLASSWPVKTRQLATLECTQIKLLSISHTLVSFSWWRPLLLTMAMAKHSPLLFVQHCCL